jgi:hypothetical protein
MGLGHGHIHVLLHPVRVCVGVPVRVTEKEQRHLRLFLGMLALSRTFMSMAMLMCQFCNEQLSMLICWILHMNNFQCLN